MPGARPSLREMLEQLSEECGIAARFEGRLEGEPGESARTACFRIAQEALRNIRRHAEAARVQMLLEITGGDLHVRVQDDGRGFHPLEAVRPGHYGVAGMRERAEDAGGQFELVSAPAQGTSVEFWLPLKEERPTDESTERT